MTWFTDPSGELTEVLNLCSLLAESTAEMLLLCEFPSQRPCGFWVRAESCPPRDVKSSPGQLPKIKEIEVKFKGSRKARFPYYCNESEPHKMNRQGGWATGGSHLPVQRGKPVCFSEGRATLPPCTGDLGSVSKVTSPRLCDPLHSGWGLQTRSTELFSWSITEKDEICLYTVLTEARMPIFPMFYFSEIRVFIYY